MATKIRNRHLARAKFPGSGIEYFAGAIYPRIPLSKSDIYVTTTIGDRLDLLAHQFYSDVNLWWVILSANPDVIRRDSYALKSGLEIRIPANPMGAVKMFKSLNNKNEY